MSQKPNPLRSVNCAESPGDLALIVLQHLEFIARRACRAKAQGKTSPKAIILSAEFLGGQCAPKCTIRTCSICQTNNTTCQAALLLAITSATTSGELENNLGDFATRHGIEFRDNLPSISRWQLICLVHKLQAYGRRECDCKTLVVLSETSTATSVVAQFIRDCATFLQCFYTAYKMRDGCRIVLYLVLDALVVLWHRIQSLSLCFVAHVLKHASTLLLAVNILAILPCWSYDPGGMPYAYSTTLS